MAEPANKTDALHSEPARILTEEEVMEGVRSGLYNEAHKLPGWFGFNNTKRNFLVERPLHPSDTSASKAIGRWDLWAEKTKGKDPVFKQACAIWRMAWKRSPLVMQEAIRDVALSKLNQIINDGTGTSVQLAAIKYVLSNTEEKQDVKVQDPAIDLNSGLPGLLVGPDNGKSNKIPNGIIQDAGRSTLQST